MQCIWPARRSQCTSMAGHPLSFVLECPNFGGTLSLQIGVLLKCGRLMVVCLHNFSTVSVCRDMKNVENRWCLGLPLRDQPANQDFPGSNVASAMKSLGGYRQAAPS